MDLQQFVDQIDVMTCILIDHSQHDLRESGIKLRAGAPNQLLPDFFL